MHWNLKVADLVLFQYLAINQYKYMPMASTTKLFLCIYIAVNKQTGLLRLSSENEGNVQPHVGHLGSWHGIKSVVSAGGHLMGKLTACLHGQ